MHLWKNIQDDCKESITVEMALLPNLTAFLSGTIMNNCTPHCGLSVPAWLDNHFLGRWIGL